MRKKKISEEDIHAASAGFYEVLLGGATWDDSLLPLLPMFDINCIHFLTFDTRKQIPQALGAVGVRSTSEVAADVAAYDSYYHKIDVRTAHTVQNQVSKIATCRDYCDDRFVRNNEVYQDYLIPRGYEYLMAAKVASRKDSVVMIGIFRSGKRYSRDEIAHFQPLVHHLGRAIQLQWRLQGLDRKLFAQAQALDALSFGVLVTNSYGHVYHANHEAEQILRRINAVKMIQGRLRCGLSFEQTRLDQLLRSVVQHGISDGMRVRDVTTRQEWHLWAVPARDGLGFANERLAVIVITNPNQPPSLDMILQRVFGFTFAEVKLASALATGCTVADYAERECISITTARTHVRAILGKAGVKRLTDLMRLLASSALLVTKQL